MKATGIVRRIDDLGRVVIPKEIRRTMRIREGDPLEIYTNPDGEVIFKKYSAINEMSEGAAQAAEVISKLGGAPAVVIRTTSWQCQACRKKSIPSAASPLPWRSFWKTAKPLTIPIPQPSRLEPSRVSPPTPSPSPLSSQTAI